jgi:hypothetical protein
MIKSWAFWPKTRETLFFIIGAPEKDFRSQPPNYYNSLLLWANGEATEG